MRGLVLAVLLALPAAAQQAAVYLPPPGTGVSVGLSNQREIRGTFLGERDGAVWVGVDGGEVGLDPADIVTVRTQDNDDVEYRRRAARAGRDAGAWWALAQWAKERGLHGSAEDSARRVVELSPEHAGARALLGQEKIGGAWLEHDAAMKAKGFVPYGGDWLKREEYERLERERRAAREEERMELYLAIEEARVSAARMSQALPAHPPWWWAWWSFGVAPGEPDRGSTRYTVPLWRNQPFQPHFHEGYFRRAGF